MNCSNSQKKFLLYFLSLFLVFFGVFGTALGNIPPSVGIQKTLVLTSTSLVSSDWDFIGTGNPNSIFKIGTGLKTFNAMYSDGDLNYFMGYGRTRWGDGDFVICRGNGSTCNEGEQYATYSITGGLFIAENPIPPDTTTRFTAFTVSTSTQTVNVQGYWNATTTPDISEKLEFYQYSSLLGRESYSSISATSSGNFNFNFSYLGIPTPAGTTTVPITATTAFHANIYQINDVYYDPFGVQNPAYSTLLVSTSTSLTGSTTSYTLDTSRAIALYPEYECSLTNMIGCIKNAGIALFYPSQETLDRTSDFYEKLQQKAPFGYFSVVKNQIGGISATGTPTFSITIPAHIKSVIFDPFDTALATVLTLFFIFNFYKRLKHITI